MKKTLALLLCAAFVLALPAGCAPEPQPEQPKEKPPLPVLKDQFGNSAVGYEAAVVCADPASARAGLEIMQSGGGTLRVFSDEKQTIFEGTLPKAKNDQAAK